MSSVEVHGRISHIGTVTTRYGSAKLIHVVSDKKTYSLFSSSEIAFKLLEGDRIKLLGEEELDSRNSFNSIKLKKPVIAYEV
jgi:hypothetical protein